MIRRCGFFSVALVLMISGFIEAKEIQPYVGYDISETVRTETDHRDRYTQIYLDGGGYAGFSYHEVVYGATDKIVTAIEYRNKSKIVVAQADQKQLTDALLNAKVFELIDDPRPELYAKFQRPFPEPAYGSSLDVRIKNQDKRFWFYTFPNTPSRAAIHQIMFDFAKRMKVDQPYDLSKATFISEGDLEPAQSVKLAELLAHPKKYHGKRVSVSGYRHLEFEGNRLCINKEASEKHSREKCIGSGGISSFADSKKFNGKNDTFQIVDGVFVKGPDLPDGAFYTGWPGGYIRRITNSKTVSDE